MGARAPLGGARAAQVLAIAAIAGAVAVAIAVVARRADRDEVQCGPGFRAAGARCLVAGEGACPAPLVPVDAGCDAPEARVRVPETTIEIGPSDWEAEGRVPARTVHVAAFEIDAFEATAGRFAHAATDRARAASGMTRDEAGAWCASRGGRLPTEDEWIAAAASGPSGSARRYPWGETGAVCRRAAWGLATGPCATGGDGPDTAGAHPSGDTPTGLHDMAGNVAEWVAADPGRPDVGVAKGGSWASALATELRTWSRLEIAPGARDARVGTRCAFPAR